MPRLFILILVLLSPLLLFGEPVDDPVMNHPLMESNHPSQEHFVSEFFNMLFILGMTLVVMLVIAWFLKRFMYARLQQGNQSSSITIEDRRTLSPRSMIYILNIDNTRIIVGETPAGLVRLGELSSTNQPDDPDSRTSFSKLLDKPVR